MSVMRETLDREPLSAIIRNPLAALVASSMQPKIDAETTLNQLVRAR